MSDALHFTLKDVEVGAHCDNVSRQERPQSPAVYLAALHLGHEIIFGPLLVRRSVLVLLPESYRQHDGVLEQGQGHEQHT